MLCCGLQEWSYLRGGLTTVDRDYGIFSQIHHSIGIHVLHHLFRQVSRQRYQLPCCAACQELLQPDPARHGPYWAASNTAGDVASKLAVGCHWRVVHKVWRPSSSESCLWQHFCCS